jgi:hypothetical protein
MDRHEFHRGHAQRLQIRNLLDHAQIGARVGNAAARAGREAADMHFVDDRVGQTTPQVPVPLPVEGVVDHHALRRPDDGVAAGQKMAGERPRIGIDEPGLAVEQLAPLGIERPVGLEVIELAMPYPRHEDAPDIPPTVLVGVEGDHLRRLGIVDRVVEQHPHRRG